MHSGERSLDVSSNPTVTVTATVEAPRTLENTEIAGLSLCPANAPCPHPAHISEPAKRRPAVVMQEDWLLASDIATVLVVPVTSNLTLEAFPGNVLIPVDASGLDKDSVAIVSQVGPVSREYLDAYSVGHLPGYVVTRIADGIRLVMGI